MPLYVTIKGGVDTMQQYTYPPYRQYLSQPVVTKDAIRKNTQSKLRKRCTAIGFYALTYMATMIALSTGITLILTQLNINITETLKQFSDTFISVGSAFIPGILFMAAIGFKPREAFGKTSVGFTTLLPLVLMGMAVAMMSNIASSIFESNLSLFGLQNHAGYTESDAYSPLDIILTLISGAIVPAFAEEFAFRGLIMGSLKKYGRAFAVIGSSILFSALHANTTQIVFTFPVALVFGYIDMVTDSIIPSIILHFMNNFYAFLLTIFSTNNNLDSNFVFTVQLVIILLFVISGLLSFIYLVKSKKLSFDLSDKENHSEPGANLLTMKNKMCAFLVNPGVMIALSAFLLITILNFFPVS